MAAVYKWFVDIKQGGYVDFVSLLVDGYQELFEFPSILWHDCLSIDVNHVELIDALVDLKTFLVNFYTKEGNEIDYRYTKDYLPKCLVVGCHDPTMYQSVSHDLILNSRSGRGGKHVEIAFNGVVSRIRLYCSVFSNLTKPVVVAFTDSKWERIVDRESFSSSKVIVVSSDEYGGSLAGKVLDGVLPDIDMVPSAPG